MVLSSTTSNGNAAAVVRLTANGIGGPLTALANTKRTACGGTLKPGSASTLTLIRLKPEGSCGLAGTELAGSPGAILASTLAMTAARSPLACANAVLNLRLASSKLPALKASMPKISNKVTLAGARANA